MNPATLSSKQVLRQQRKMERKICDGLRRQAELKSLKYCLDQLSSEMENRPGLNELYRLNKKAKTIMKRSHQLSDRNRLGRRLYWRKLRNILAVVVLVLFFIQMFGLPHLRLSYQYTGPASHPNIITATYGSVTGSKKATDRQYDQGCPLITLIPLEPSLFIQSQNLIGKVWLHLKAKIAQKLYRDERITPTAFNQARRSRPWTIN